MIEDQIPYMDLELIDTQEKFVIVVAALINELVKRENERTRPKIITDLSTAPVGSLVSGTIH